jgi:sRNA-binding regulator protein Hfq
MDTGCNLVFVLRNGEEISGQLSWYDQHCLKISPRGGSPGLLIPKHTIKYLYEASDS